MTTANKFSVLTTEDEVDTEIDETSGHEEASSGGQPGITGRAQLVPHRSEASDQTVVPDGTIPTMGVVPPGAAITSEIENENN